MLVDVVEAMKLGKAISVMPIDQRLTTQEAADFLGISRPTFIKLLDSGAIPFERPSGSRHRRIRLVDVLRYQDQRRTESRETLDTMASEAYEAGLYEATTDDSTSALRAARKGHAPSRSTELGRLPPQPAGPQSGPDPAGAQVTGRGRSQTTLDTRRTAPPPDGCRRSSVHSSRQDPALAHAEERAARPSLSSSIVRPVDGATDVDTLDAR